MKQLQLQTAAGVPLTSFDFGEVPEGQLSAPLPIRLTNTGDVALTGLKAWIEPAASGLRVTVGGTLITATSSPTAQALGNLAVGAFLAGSAEFLGSALPLATGTLRVRGD